MTDIFEVKSKKSGKIFEVVIEDDGYSILVREKGSTDWQEGTWGSFCQKNEVDYDALS